MKALVSGKMKLATHNTYIGDDGAEALTDALVGNKSLVSLYFDNNTITSAGWSAFLRLLGDPSSITNIYKRVRR